MKKFRFQLHIDSVLTPDQIWPDGDAPDNPTVEDVVRVAERDAYAGPTTPLGMCQLADQWNLVVDGRASITEVNEDSRLQEEAQAAADNAMIVDLLERAERAEFDCSQRKDQLAAIVAGLRELVDAELITESRAAEIAGVRIEDLQSCDATSHQQWKLAVEQRVATERECVRQLLKEQDQLFERNNEQRQRAEKAELWLAINRRHWDDEKAERQRLERVEAELLDRVAELEKLAGRLNWDLHDAERRAEQAEARVKELEPPEGHVAVWLPREDAEEWADLHFGIGRRQRVTETCHKALEADDE